MLYTKIIAAAVSCFAIVGSIGSYASNSTITEASAEVETAVASAEATIMPAAGATAAEEGAEIRKNLNLTTGTVISYNEGVELFYANGNRIFSGRGERIWIIGVDDANQRFRVYIPLYCSEKMGTVLFMAYSSCTDEAKNVEGMPCFVMGDLYRDEQVDIYDLAMMKRGLLNGGFRREMDNLLADVNNDGKFTVLDIVCMQKWLLSAE